MMKLLLLHFWISLSQVLCICFVVQADTGLLLDANGERHSEEYCAMYDICGTREDGKVLNCPYGSPSIKPDDLFSRKIQSLCPTITGNVCCTEAQFDTLRAQVLHAIPFLAGCPACLRNFLNLFCELFCSPRQSLFINVTSVSKVKNNLTVDAIDFYITDAFGEGLHDSCKDVKFGSLNTRALDFIGAGAQNFKEWYAFIGRRANSNPLGAPYAITFRSIVSESSGMKPMNVSTYSCDDVTLGCSCGDCSSSAVCANTFPPSQHDVGFCSIRIGSLKAKCIDFGLTILYVAMVSTVIGWGLSHRKNGKVQLTRIKSLVNSNISDGAEVNSIIKLAETTLPMPVLQSTIMESLANSNILDGVKVDPAIKLAETSLSMQMSQSTRKKLLANSNISDGAKLDSMINLAEVTLPMQVSSSTRMELLINLTISNGAKVDSMIRLAETTLLMHMPLSTRMESLINSNISDGTKVDFAIKLMKMSLPMQVAQIFVDGSNENRIMTQKLKIFTLAELKSATKNFSPDMVLGEGGFGKVFKGWIDEKSYAPSEVGVGMAVAIKKSKPNSSQGLREWEAEVKFLGKFRHANLVKLLGYCREEDQFLLVYEYMQKGSLENHLFKDKAEPLLWEPLLWETRLKIAIGAAEGLAHLHTWEKSVIYRDFKTSNILLDSEYNAKLSDFGLAKLGPINGNSHVTTHAMGTYGYIAPEYAATGQLYVKSDVYGFGVVLLELLTGLRALDHNRPHGEHYLVEWAKPSLSNKKKLMKIMDPRLKEQYPAKAATRISELITRCLESDPNGRPSMGEVLSLLKKASEVSSVNTKS